MVLILHFLSATTPNENNNKKIIFLMKNITLKLKIACEFSIDSKVLEKLSR